LYTESMDRLKKVIWLGDTRSRIRKVPVEAAQALGKNLLNVQQGLAPYDWRPFPQIGPGVIEIRVHRPHEHRLFYIARLGDAIYVLHVFQKKTQRTSQLDIEIARTRYARLQKDR
jgi:phage-related protein